MDMGSADVLMKCGARGSRLSVVQAEGAISFLASHVEGFRARLVTFETPGDRDLSTPIEKSPPDFFTRDLDDAVRVGKIDFAVHSAKDLPERIDGDLDWFWLPNHEDPRDCVVMRRDWIPPARGRFRIGVSSSRRSDYAGKRFPKAKLLPIRGAVDSRLAQLAEGRFDAVIMAMAGLKRLCPDIGGGGSPFRVEPIPETELQPPEGQGYLAVVFRKGDARMSDLRRRFVKAVRFTSAGVGSAGLITVRGAQDLAAADGGLADELSGFVESSWRVRAKWISVGKRCGRHSMEQTEITRLICDEVRKGRRVVRLKGGDAGLFGRLSEETEALDSLGIPYLVRPGVSALTAATSPNGLLLTKRGESGGFAVSTPRSDGAKMPQVFFMATRLARETLGRFHADERYAMVWDAGGANERIETGLCGNPRLGTSDAPGLLVVGYAGTPLCRKRVLLTCSDAVMPHATCRFEDRGWRTIEWPMITLRPRQDARVVLSRLDERRYDAIVLTSPGAVRTFFALWDGDRRSLPELWTCGSGTDAELRKHGVASDLMPERDFSAKGLIARLKREKDRLRGMRVLRLRSAKAGKEIATALRRRKATVDDVVLYDTEPVRRDGVALPKFDAVFFASTSSVESFLSQYGTKPLARREIYVIGDPTRRALPPGLRSVARQFPISEPDGQQ